MVSATPSGGWFQSSPVIPGLGFSLTTRAQMFWLEEGLNSTLKPSVRPRTTLTPSMVYRDGSPYMAFGTPGGDQQDQWQLIMFLRHVHKGMNLQQAIDAPSFHTDHLPGSFWPREINRGAITLESVSRKRCATNWRRAATRSPSVTPGRKDAFPPWQEKWMATRNW